MIRVLEVLATLQRAGAENMAVSLACGLDRKRFDCGVVSLFDSFPNSLEPVLEACGVPVWHLGKRPGFDPLMYVRLRHVVREFRPDIIHTHSYVMRYTLHLQARAMVHTVHNLADREVEPLGRLLHRWAFRRGVVPVAIAGEVARSFRELYGRDPAATIPNGIDVGRFARPGSRSAWRAAHGFSEHDLLIVSGARLAEQKNPLLLAEAAAAVPGAQLLLAGDGPLQSKLEGCPGVHLLGVRTDLPDVYAAADIFALASDWEGHPLSVMEAMAAGLPVVATAVGGVPEIVGDAGMLVPPRDVGALAGALRRLAEDPALRRELSSKAAQRAGAFEVGIMVESYAALFEQVLRR